VSRNPLHQRLIQIVEPVVASSGFELVDLRFLLEQGGWTLRIQIDRPPPDGSDLGSVPDDRVDLQACEAMSRELSAVLDVNDPIAQAYSLEVSSPGIERPLRTAAHFAHFSGSEAKIALAIPQHVTSPDGTPQERRNFRGVLRGVADDKVAIDCDGTTFHLPIADIDSAKLVADWDAVMHGSSGVGNRAATVPAPSHKSPKHKQKQRQKEP
jgi:ribosome maturation factor RimP